MEDKVEALEASGQAALELAGEDLESKFAELEGGDEIETLFRPMDALKKVLFFLLLLILTVNFSAGSLKNQS